jgi:outer membrane protein assembly factor BamB
VRIRVSCTAAFVVAASSGFLASAGPPANWPQFRGRGASGVADGPAPSTWNAEKSENVRWKTPIPGLAHSSPIVWGDQVFVTTAVATAGEASLRVGLYGDGGSADDDGPQAFRVYCLDRRTGKILWERTACESAPKGRRHTKASHANSTPCTDGQRLIAFFGSQGMFCYNLSGELLWKLDLGVLESGPYNAPGLQWGFASSPIIYRDLVIVQCDVLKQPFIAAYDLKDGRNVWLTPRTDVCTWSTPTVVEGSGRAELIANGFQQSAGYDPLTGKELWTMNGGGDVPVPTPLSAHGLIFLHSAHGPASPIFAIRPGASGDISLERDATSNASIVWSVPRGAPYIPTGVVYGDYLYACKDNGLLTCYEARTGKQLYQQRINDKTSLALTASPVAADGKVYFTSEDGDIFVVKAGPTFELLATNPMGEVCMATPAITDGMIYVRTKGHVYGVAEAGAKSTD